MVSTYDGKFIYMIILLDINLILEVKCTSVGKISKKNNLKECVFVNSALNIQFNVVKNTLPQTAFSVRLSVFNNDCTQLNAVKWEIFLAFIFAVNTFKKYLLKRASFSSIR